MTQRPLTLADFDYHLPPERIAQHPINQRDHARLLTCHSDSGTLAHHQVRDLPTLLRAGDLLVFNRTRVIPARLAAHKESGGQVEILLVHPVSEDGQRWNCLIRGKVREHTKLHIADHTATVMSILEDGSREILFTEQTDVLALAEQHGAIPLPPYIDRQTNSDDHERYQTVFGDSPGSVAAPTAALHFTPDLLQRLENAGISHAKVDLAVGPGTFKPVQEDSIEQHKMHAEHCECPSETVDAIQACRERGGRVIAVGTTVVRTLETACEASGAIAPYKGWTNIFLRPPYAPRAVDGLVTNFHLPRSTLLMLVACFTGLETLHRCYRAAIEEEYRFYSYGDAMLILPQA